MKLPEHLFISDDDGGLYDTRKTNWSETPIRAVYRRTFREIDNPAELRATLRAGPYAWPGDYQMFFLASDGAALSFRAVQENFYQCAYSLRHKIDDGWRIVACDINYEDTNMVCDHTGEPIPSAYGDDK